MSSSTIAPLFSYLGWSFLPNLATQFLQSIYYRITLSAGTPHPQPGTALYARDYRRIRILVLISYFLYTVTQSLYDVKLAGDFYTLLSIDPYHSTEKEIRTRLRRLAARYHPDKQSNPAEATVNERVFLQLRLAGETLTTRSHKYAYTHFGPDILTHLPKPSDDGSSSSTKNSALDTARLVTLALRQKLPSYIMMLAFVFALNTFLLPSSNRTGKYWRYLILAASFALEFYLLTHDIPALPGLLDTSLRFLRERTRFGDILPPHLLPFQILQISTSLAISLNIFISQISAMFPSRNLADGDIAQMKGWMQQLTANLGNLAAVSGRIDQDATSLLQLQFAPYRGQVGPVRHLRRGMKEGMVMGNVRGHPEVREAVKRVIEKRNRENEARKVQKEDGAEVVDLLNGDEQFI